MRELMHTFDLGRRLKMKGFEVCGGGGTEKVYLKLICVKIIYVKTIYVKRLEIRTFDVIEKNDHWYSAGWNILQSNL